MPLAVLQIKASKPAEKAFTLNDRSGLALLVKPNGSKYWHLHYCFQGRAAACLWVSTRMLPYKEARELATECRSQLKQGADPGTKRRDDKLQCP